MCEREREGGNNSLEKKEKKFPVTRILFNNVNKIRMRKICQKVIRNNKDEWEDIWIKNIYQKSDRERERERKENSPAFWINK